MMIDLHDGCGLWLGFMSTVEVEAKVLAEALTLERFIQFTIQSIA